MDPEVFTSNYEDSGLIGGWRYCATLQLQTPLAYLEMDGEFSPGRRKPPLVGPAENFLPDGTGFNPYGIWLPEIDYGGLGFDPPPPGRRATQWGQIQIASEAERDLLSFLKSFRYIVETAEDLDQALSELVELSASTERNERTWAKLKKDDPLFPDSFFIGQLEVQLPKGVGLSKAKKLYLAGFRTIEQIQAATDQELLEVEGLGKGILKKIRNN